MNRWRSHLILTACGTGAFLLGKADWNSGESGDSDSQKASAATESANRFPTDPGSAVTWLEQASREDCEALIAKQGLAGLSPLLREALLLRLSELDPQRLADLIFAMPGNGRGMASWQSWIGWLAKKHPEILEQHVASLSVVQQEAIDAAVRLLRYEFRGDPVAVFEENLKKGKGAQAAGALTQIAKTDPDLAISLLSKLMAEGLLIPTLDASFYRKLANINPAAMEALLPLARTPELKTQIAMALARVLARDDPSLALPLFDSLPPSNARSQVAIEIATAWTKRDPEAALAWVQEHLPNGAAKRKALAITLAPIAESDPGKVIPLLAGIREGETSRMMSDQNATIPQQVLETAVAALMKESPADAVAMLYSGAPPSTNGSGFQPLLTKSVGTWFASDPEGAIHWLAGLDQKERSGMMSYSVFTEQVTNIPPELAAKGAGLLGQIEDPQSAGQMATILATTMGKSDLAAAIKTAGEIPEAMRSSWIWQAIQSHARVDPLAAAAQIDHLPESSRASAHTAVASELAKVSPTQAFAYLDGLEPANRTAQGFDDAVSQASRANWNETYAWWNKLPEDDLVARSGALSSIAGKLYAADPTTAGNLREQIGAIADGETRARALTNLIQGMARLDPQAARKLAAEPGMELPKWAPAMIKRDLESAIPE